MLKTGLRITWSGDSLDRNSERWDTRITFDCGFYSPIIHSAHFHIYRDLYTSSPNQPQMAQTYLCRSYGFSSDIWDFRIYNPNATRWLCRIWLVLAKVGKSCCGNLLKTWWPLPNKIPCATTFNTQCSRVIRKDKLATSHMKPNNRFFPNCHTWSIATWLDVRRLAYFLYAGWSFGIPTNEKQTKCVIYFSFIKIYKINN